jgi:hypothetical protein
VSLDVVPDVIAAAIAIGYVVSLSMLWRAHRTADDVIRARALAGLKWSSIALLVAVVAIILGVIGLALSALGGSANQ